MIAVEIGEETRSLSRKSGYLPQTHDAFRLKFTAFSSAVKCWSCPSLCSDLGIRVYRGTQHKGRQAKIEVDLLYFPCNCNNATLVYPLPI